jgi:hypothetical protein
MSTSENNGAVRHIEGCPCNNADERGCFLISANTNKCVSCTCHEDIKWQTHYMLCLAKNQCPYSGLGGPECKSWLCDCFEFEDIWGVSQK